MKNLIRKIFKRPARIDHQPMYVAMVFALGVWSASLLLFGPTPSSVIDELSLSTQYLLAGVIFCSAFLCQFGIFIGTRWSIWVKGDVRTAYGLAIGGIPALAIALEIYFWAIVNGATSPFSSALGAAISFAIPIGALWNMMMFIVRRWEIEDYLEGRRREIINDDDYRPSD